MCGIGAKGRVLEFGARGVGASVITGLGDAGAKAGRYGARRFGDAVGAGEVAGERVGLGGAAFRALCFGDAVGGGAASESEAVWG